MTVFVEGLGEIENIWLGVQKHGKIEKVTGSENDKKREWRRTVNAVDRRAPCGPSPAVGMTDSERAVAGENGCRGGTPFRIDRHHFCANEKVTGSRDDKRRGSWRPKGRFLDLGFKNLIQALPVPQAPWQQPARRFPRPG